MVVHDESQVQAWAQEREEKRQARTKKEILPRRLSVLAVQSVACCVTVMLALLLRMAGGEAYTALRQSFYHALERNEWVTVWALMWDGDPLENMRKSNVKDIDFTKGESLQPADLASLDAHA